MPEAPCRFLTETEAITPSKGGGVVQNRKELGRGGRASKGGGAGEVQRPSLKIPSL